MSGQAVTQEQAAAAAYRALALAEAHRQDYVHPGYTEAFAAGAMWERNSALGQLSRRIVKEPALAAPYGQTEVGGVVSHDAIANFGRGPAMQGLPLISEDNEEKARKLREAGHEGYDYADLEAEARVHKMQAESYRIPRGLYLRRLLLLICICSIMYGAYQYIVS